MAQLIALAASVRGLRMARGQGVVEFTLVFPIFLIVFISLIEFAFVFHTALGLNFATRNASLIGAEAGNRVGADCEIVAAVQKSIDAPMNETQVRSVTIFQADQSGANTSGLKDVWTFVDGAQTPCPTESNPNQKVDFKPVIGWPSSSVNPGPPATTVVGQRCDVLAGCLQADGVTYASLDSVGVSIVYHYDYHTPLGNFLALPGWGPGFDLTWSNVNRMEPTL